MFMTGQQYSLLVLKGASHIQCDMRTPTHAVIREELCYQLKLKAWVTVGVQISINQGFNIYTKGAPWLLNNVRLVHPHLTFGPRSTVRKDPY
jgi:hypothetical protein